MERESHGSSTLTREQKTGFVFLLVFGVMAVSLGFLQLRNNIYNPFAIKLTVEDGTNLFVDEDVRLQQIDTDQDGLNDYEELYFYETSPYLPDTDSDGISDKDELDNGSDPLCPEGQACETATAIIDSGVDLPEEPVLDPASDVSMSIDQAQMLLNDPAQLRELLKTQGKLSQEEVDAIDDATLLEVANKSFSTIAQDNTQ